MSPDRPMTQAPSPPPPASWAKNTNKVPSPQMSQENTCVLVAPRRIERMQGLNRTKVRIAARAPRVSLCVIARCRSAWAPRRLDQSHVQPVEVPKAFVQCGERIAARDGEAGEIGVGDALGRLLELQAAAHESDLSSLWLRLLAHVCRPDEF